MSSRSLPSPGSAVRLRVSYVEASAELSLVRLWGSEGELSEEYRRLREHLQSAAPAYPSAPAPAGPAELCVLEVGGLWLRCQLLQPGPAPELRVFLLDLGYSCSAPAAKLRQAPAAIFRLPPQVRGYVLPNLLPQDRQSWSEPALSFLGSLQGQLVSGLVQDLILPKGIVLLEVPAVSKQLVELGLARPLPDSAFRAILERFLKPPEATVMFPANAVMPGMVMTPPPPPSAPPAWGMDFFYPQIQVGVTEPVIVTQVCDPQRIYCQLRSLSNEVQRLSESMNHYYEMQTSYMDPNVPLSFVLGQPCASRSKDGHWHRSLLQEYLPDKHLATVIHVDWGRKEIIPVTALRTLAPDYFRMPIVTFPCSLYGVSDEGTGWDPPQLFELRSLLFGRPLTAKIEFYNSYAHLYVVNLFGDDGLNVNSLFNMRAQTMHVCKTSKLVAENTPKEDESSKVEVETQETPEQHFYVPTIPTLELDTGTFYDALVEFVIDPSNFWIKTTENATQYNEIVDSITALYSKASKLEGIIAKPQKGQLCCTKFANNQYFRAEVVATHGKQVEVYFIDHGNTEIVNWYDVKKLPAQYSDMPGLAIHCSLADIYPMDKCWSSEAILAFKVAVVDKKLVIYVICKESHKYVIEVLDQSRIEERSVGKILSAAGHAKYVECEPVDHIPKLLTAMTIGKRKKFQAGDTVSLKNPVSTFEKIKEIKPAQSMGDNVENVQRSPFASLVFEPGTTIEVAVSFVESPGLFWCQNIAHISKLESLMYKIRDYCSNASCPFDGSSPGCIARSPSDGQWYRAFITKMPCLPTSETIEVQYVDYGNKETVPVKDLRAIRSEFLNLRAQAFKCSLYNIIAPLGNNAFCWDKRATAAFNEFVDRASGKLIQFYCMFFASALLENKLFNIVDLFTPFTSICSLLVDRGFATRLSHKTLDPSVQLHSYFYSMHDIKIGSEEEIYITHITSSLEFYCQLSRNTEVIETISSTVKQVASDTLHYKMSKNPSPLCLAKFTDQQWYRGFICGASNPKIFFVDFGNTDKVEDKNLLPIKSNAYELLLSPMQAIKCSLSDIPPNVPDEIVSWFEKTVLDKPLKALVVAKETDGKLVVELYDDSQQINASLKKKLGLKTQQSTGLPLSHTQSAKMGNNDSRQNPCHADKVPTRGSAANPRTRNLKTEELTPVHSASYSGKQTKGLPTNDKDFTVIPRLNRKLPKAMSTSGETSQVSFSPLIKLSDLPKKSIYPGLNLPVFISHINSVYDFYVQIAQDQELSNISEMLNKENEKSSELLSEKDVCVGDVVCSYFADDELNYRAVIRAKNVDGLQVEYIDYGNASVVPVDKISRLPKELCSYPVMSYHSALYTPSSAMSGFNADDLILKFSERTNDVQLTCEFLQLCDEKWDVRLCDDRGCINDFMTSISEEPLSTEPDEDLSIKSTGKSPDEEATAFKFFVWNLPQIGETVQVYASTVDSPEHFWCQLTTSDIDGLAAKIQEAGEGSVKDENFNSSLEIGSPCNVMSSDDSNWYRAIVANIDKDLVTIRFVDYGNEETVGFEQIRELPSLLGVVPVLAFPCALAGFNFSEGSWTSEANTIFYEKVTEDHLEISIVDVKDLGISNVPLLFVNVKYKGNFVNEEMTPYWIEGNKTGLNVCAALAEDINPQNISLELENISDSETLLDSIATNVRENHDLEQDFEQIERKNYISQDSLSTLDSSPNVLLMTAQKGNDDEVINRAKDLKSSKAHCAPQEEASCDTSAGIAGNSDSFGLKKEQNEQTSEGRTVSQYADLLGEVHLVS
ncbi:Hypothetical predicted protein [Pelobates cultripes]|uniref:Tudor domain-containing protein n=1 Tax=Pelobates cultripes TaxID=61616 RepID=A0AAD1VSF0_PELCU|nr:Hypothetical predicted protein [Pelobates cultripes]